MPYISCKTKKKGQKSTVVMNYHRLCCTRMHRTVRRLGQEYEPMQHAFNKKPSSSINRSQPARQQYQTVADLAIKQDLTSSCSFQDTQHVANSKTSKHDWNQEKRDDV